MSEKRVYEGEVVSYSKEEYYINPDNKACWIGSRAMLNDLEGKRVRITVEVLDDELSCKKRSIQGKCPRCNGVVILSREHEMYCCPRCGLLFEWFEVKFNES